METSHGRTEGVGPVANGLTHGNTMAMTAQAAANAPLGVPIPASPVIAHWARGGHGTAAISGFDCALINHDLRTSSH